MRAVNRTVVVLKPKRPFLDWINDQDDAPSSPVTLTELQQDCTALLTPMFDNNEEALAFLESRKVQLLEQELAAWYRDPTLWPIPRTADLFDRWIQLEVHSMVFDLLDEAITKEDVSDPMTEPIMDLETFRQRVRDAFFPEAFHEGLPMLTAGEQAITDYRRLIGDVTGLLDLMLFHVEQGTQFSNTYGDIDEAFYESLEMMLEQFCQLLLVHPEQYEVGNLARRVWQLEGAAGGIGWGYGDFVGERLSELRYSFDDG